MKKAEQRFKEIGLPANGILPCGKFEPRTKISNPVFELRTHCSADTFLIQGAGIATKSYSQLLHKKAGHGDEHRLVIHAINPGTGDGQSRFSRADYDF
jgi:hypothetical protein